MLVTGSKEANIVMLNIRKHVDYYSDLCDIIPCNSWDKIFVSRASDRDKC